MWTRALMLGLLCGSTFLLTGCGAGKEDVEIKVMNGSQPYNPATDGVVAVGISPDAGANGASFNERADESGVVRLKGVPAGKYGVTVSRYPAEVDPGKETGKKGSPPPPSQTGSKKTSEVWDISSSNRSFTLDLTKVK